jgi:peptidyl-tRNA hydrolase, PTH1 family
MKLIAGLGNPGAEYTQTRHNVGFFVVDRLANRWEIDLGRRKHRALCGSGMFGTEKVILLKPQTFMNRSGESVVEAASFYKVDLQDILVVLDDMALSLGQIRLRSQGTSGGHNGLQDVLNKLGSLSVSRLRIGIGSPRYGDAVNYVLSDFTEPEAAELKPVLPRAVSAVECWVAEGMEAAMNKFNVLEPN